MISASPFLGYTCSLCGAQYPAHEAIYVCPHDGGNLDITLDLDAIRRGAFLTSTPSARESSLWRYLPLLPVSDPDCFGTPLRAAGWTPLYTPPLLTRQLGLSRLWIKDEGRNPTASFKDRASAVVVARAKEIRASVLVTASTGNAGAALAGMAAAAGMRALIFAPRTAPPAKVAQLLVYGAQVILIEGNYDAAFELTIQAAQEYGWYCRNTGYNPFTIEGKKTAAYEIWETIYPQLTHSLRPLCIFVSVGDGNIISGLHKGFKELQELGWLEGMPRLFGVQAQGSAAIANAWDARSETIQPVAAQTLADSISVDLPRDGVRAVRAALQTGGAYLKVSDESILQAIPALGAAGIFAEPAGAAAYAGLISALEQGIIDPEDPVLVLNTGSGLKDVKAAMQSVRPAPVIEPTMQALRKHLQEGR